MIQNKIKHYYTYLTATNYWTPLDKNEEESKEQEEEEITMMQTTPIIKLELNYNTNNTGKKIKQMDQEKR